MTPIAAFIIAAIAGSVVRNRRRAILVIFAPWLIVLGYQSWYIASGRAVSPPSTVTHFPSALGYWLVQAIILLPAVGIAGQIGGFLMPRHVFVHDAESLGRRTRLATVLGLAASVIIILFGFVWFRQQGGTVYVAHHSSGGSPPVIGMVGLLAEFVTCGGLGLISLRRRRTAKAEPSDRSGQGAAPPDLAGRPGPDAFLHRQAAKQSS